MTFPSKNMHHSSDNRSVLTRRRAQGILGSKDTSSPHCGKKKKALTLIFPKMNAKIFWLLIKAQAPEGLKVFMTTKG